MDSTVRLRFLRSFFRREGEDAGASPTPVPRTVQQTAVRDAGTCTACGLCDLHFDAYPSVAHAEFRGPMTFVLGFARRTGIEGLGAQARELMKGDLEALEQICPVRIPFPALAAALADEAGPDTSPDTVRPKPRHDPG